MSIKSTVAGILIAAALGQSAGAAEHGTAFTQQDIGVGSGVVVGALAAGVALIPRWGRGPLAAILIYGGMLVPASGFFNVLFMFYSFVQNHFHMYSFHCSSCAALGSLPGFSFSFSSMRNSRTS